MATLGRTTASAGFEATIPSSDMVRVYRATLASAGQLNELWTYVRISAGTCTFRCVIYAADGPSGEPGTLLAVGANLTPPTAGSFAGEALRGGAVVTPVNLAAGNYWLGLHCAVSGGATLVFDDDGAGISRQSATDTFSDGTNSTWPGTATSPTSSQRTWGVLGAVVNPSGTATKIRFCTGLNVTDEGSGVIRVDSTGASPGAWTLLSTTTLASPGTFDVSSISGAYNDLLLLIIGRDTNASGLTSPELTLNGDTTGNYYNERISGSGSTATTAETLGGANFGDSRLPGSGALAGSFGVNQFTFYGYASTAWKKVVNWESYGLSGIGASGQHMQRGSGLWNSTAAITRVTFKGNGSGNLATGSQLRIYGRL
jgi:hypothetical protein